MREPMYDEFAKDLEDACDQIKLRKSVKTDRLGIRKFRDWLPFYKQAWSIAEGYVGLPKALVYWLALTPLAITSFNGFMDTFGIGIQVPLDYGSMLAVALVVFIMAFGFLSWTRFGLQRRSLELGGKQNPNYYLFYKELETIRKELKEIKENQNNGKN